MNRRMILHTVGRLLQIEAALLLLPLLTGVIYAEWKVVLSFLATVAIAVGAGTIFTLLGRTKDRMIFAREGFIIVAFAWVLMSAIGALPFVFSREIPSYVDAFFETVSGFTTTGASILTNVEAMSHGNLFWRSFTHWVGGMGVLVFIMAIFPSESGRSIHIMRAEMPGPIVGKIVPKIRDTAKILYLIYIAMTAVLTVLLLCGGMSLFDSLLHAFGTAGTGGFGTKADSVGGYSPYLQWVITIFMLLFGINFNLYYLILIGRARSALKSSELWCYLTIVGVSVAAIAQNIAPRFDTLSETVRHAAFQVSSIMTTTGFVTTNFNDWPSFSKTILIVLMFIGGCAGSTAGGIKVSRVMLLIKSIRRDVKRMLHPRSVAVVKLEGKTVDEPTIHGTVVYFAVYSVIFFLMLLLLSLNRFDFETNFTAVSACFNNIGPAFGAAYASFDVFSYPAKLLLSAAMLLGRLEIFPLLVAFSPSTWTKK
ncbi:MAG: TrkH family potassium uptake protein [Clostridia bacterium]|nr:TrkH family potassium uptake protein [Clostridia bacterium]